MKRSKVIVIVVFLIASMCSNLILTGVVIKLKNKNELMQTKLMQYEDNSLVQTSDGTIVVEDKDGAAYEDYLKKIFSNEELSEIGKKAWDFVISVNGQEFTTNTIYVDSERISILIGEVRNNLPISDGIANKGKLDNDAHQLIDYIHIYAETEYTIECEEAEDGYKYYLRFDHVKDNSIITLELSQEIKNRLHYGDKISEDRLSIVKR